MKAVAAFALMLGLVGLYFELFHAGQSRQLLESQNYTLAVNFAQFRNAAHLYVHRHAEDAQGMTDIPRTAFEQWLPSGWQPMREWKARMANRICYVFGPAEPDEIDAVRKLFRGSFALGRAEGGQLVPNHRADMPVPDFIPNGNIVSMTEVRP